jgi:hypothetical protein
MYDLKTNKLQKIGFFLRGFMHFKKVGCSININDSILLHTAYIFLNEKKTIIFVFVNFEVLIFCFFFIKKKEKN